MAAPSERAGKLSKDANGATTVDIGFSAVEIAKRFQHAKPLRLKDIPSMSLVEVLCLGHRQAELEGHIEPRSPGPMGIELDAG
jgi:hypothetical protein